MTHKVLLLPGDGIGPEIAAQAARLLKACQEAGLDIEVEEGLPFLNSYVKAALANGAIPYSPPTNSDGDDALALAEHAKAKSMQSSLNFAAYDAPTTPTNFN
ncbi:MAG: hypothetical protein VXV78_05245, partial [Pseudomonadota bacterium]|nr:hypothetical protein [Pseudomonadota bacterium]